jgi:adenosine deaminase
VPKVSPAIERLISALPKVELHVHLEGAIGRGLLRALAGKHGVRLPFSPSDGTGDEARYRLPDFDAFMRLYVAVSACLVDVEDFAAAAEDLGRAQAEQNVPYAEVTFTPMTHAARGVDRDAMLAGLAEGRTRAQEVHGVELRWVFDIVCSIPDQAEPTLDFALRMRARDPDAVVGLGLGGPELRGAPLEAYASTFARARAEGLHSLPHAGELGGPESIWAALRHLGAERIGHGIRCLEDPRLVEHLAREQIPLEVCPGSNVTLGVVPRLAVHPLPRLLEAGLAVTLASDDPQLFDTSLSQEYSRCAEAFAWDADTVVGIARAGVEHAFCDDGRRAELQEGQAKVAAGDRAAPTTSPRA